MRVILWLLALFATAVAVALMMGDNQSNVTLFWHPYRVDLSLNLVLIGLVVGFVVLHLALRALSALFAMPQQALRWRLQQRERAMHAALLDGLSHQLAGRFLRARKSAEAALEQEKALAASGHHIAHAEKLRALSHLVTAESAHALQDRATRDEHLQLALTSSDQRDAQETREGVQMRAARWALQDRDPQLALQWLDGMSTGAGRRTLALRARLKAARMAGHTDAALETARLLAKHRAFSDAAAQSLLRSLALETISDAYDVAQLQTAWARLDRNEHQMPEVAIHAAQRMVQLQGPVDQARQWLLPVWEHWMAHPDSWTDSQTIKLIHALEDGFAASDQAIDLPWLQRIEQAQQRFPRDANLQYLAGMACMQQQLWGKAQQLHTQSVQHLQDRELKRRSLRALAVLAEQRGDEAAAQDAYRQAAMV
jgi:HemY protein